MTNALVLRIIFGGMVVGILAMLQILWDALT